MYNNFSTEIRLHVDKHITVAQLKNMLENHVGVPSYALEVTDY